MAAQAFGKSDTIIGLGGFGGLAFGSFFGAAHGSLVNHQASDLSQPSPGPTAACGLQSVAPAGQDRRTWKCSS